MMSEQVLIVDVTSENFDQVVIENSLNKPVLIDFWANWCEPCKTLTPLLEQIVKTYHGELILAKIDCDEEQQIAAHFGVRSLPTVVLFKNGQPVDGFTGGTTEQDIRTMLEKHVQLPVIEEDIYEQAKKMYAEGGKEQAEGLLKELLSHEHNHMAALILYARCLAVRGEFVEADTILKSITDESCKQELMAAKAQLTFLQQAINLPSVIMLQEKQKEQPDNDELSYQLAIAQLAQQQYEQAMEGLLLLFMRNRDYHDGLPRKTLIQLFDLLGSNHPLVISYRKKLYQVLY